SKSIKPAQNASAIQHIIIIMQENHAFDNFFGEFPGLDPHYALNVTAYCEPYNYSNPSNCVHPWNADANSSLVQAVGLSHSWTTSHVAFDNTLMNGFVHAQYILGGGLSKN